MSGAGALAWRRIRDCDLQRSPVAGELRDTYRMYALAAAVHERDIKGAVTLLSVHGIRPLLLKGWAVARLYAEPGLRPTLDIDMLVRPGQLALAASVLEMPEGREYFVDTWHEEFDPLDDQGWDDLYARSEAVKIDDVEVRVLGAEDHLAFLCLHFLRHGAWRPLWLCDIAAALESRPSTFDWDLCLGSQKRRADWIACAIGLAHQLLGASVDNTPVAGRAQHLPRWLVPAVLRQFESPDPSLHLPDALIKSSLRHPSRWPRSARARWSDPVRATVRVGGAFNQFPRFPYQLADYLIHTGGFVRRLPQILSG
jgi:hypothetical protein